MYKIFVCMHVHTNVFECLVDVNSYFLEDQLAVLS